MTRFRPLILGAALLVAAEGGALAQSDTGQPTEEVVIYAPYIVHTTEGPSGRPMQPLRIVTVTRRVSYAGIDLSKPAEASAFEKTIRDAARDVCRELDRRMHHPGYQPITDLKSCTSKTTNEALATTRELIAAARGS